MSNIIDRSIQMLVMVIVEDNFATNAINYNKTWLQDGLAVESY